MKLGRRWESLTLLIFWVTTFVAAQPVKVVSPEENLLNSRFNQAQRLEREGHLTQAAEIYQALVDARPANYLYYSNYVNLLFRQKNLPELERVITRFIQLNPNHENAAINLGKLYYVRGDSAAAFQEWQKAIEKFNHNISFYRALFNEMVGLKLYDEAEHLIAQARAHYKQPDLLTMELANLQIARGKYNSAARELLLYARANPRYYNMIAGQILRFPTDSTLFIQIDSLLRAELSLLPDQAALHRLRADFLFKNGRYNTALEEIFQVEALTGNRGDQALAMAKNLVQIRRYELAQDFYTKILAKKELQGVAPQALLGLAEAFEKTVLEQTTAEPLHYFYSGNLFFNTDFVQQINQEQSSLQKAFAIYDSLVANQPNSVYSARALYRLADLRFRVVRDFDGALNLLRQAQNITRDRQLNLNCALRIGEVQIARGDPDAAIKYYQTEIARWEGTPGEKDLRVHLALAQFLAQEFDSLDVELKNLIPLLGPKHALFNDVVGFDGFFRANYSETDATGKKAFGEFAKAELLLRQNKLSEAEKVYAFILQNYPQTPIISAARFRLTQILLQFDRYSEAEATAEPFFASENENADQVAFMLAEVADRRDANYQTAAYYYELILEKYPNSFLIDSVRKRLRELQHLSDVKKEI
ncbi:MAG TPA: tetratricopeptide repeat protein [Candidatus Marinimicrobia bacterium]|nr:tetratricopeptide repeat protein [Candidatus Neomarinimicrobiota bacterium]HRS52306.1 tetratricopeptide repeat protein [Candidatus Neomarinimicrobiota bacterium]HRU92044.1 tetratricopeptide repeat protein [Candidatus Neomarinimicrobiota bacterium]